MTVAGIPSASRAADTKFRVSTATPVNRDHCFVSLVIEVYDGLLDERTRQALFSARFCARCIPNSWQIVSERNERCTINLRTTHSLRLKSFQTLLNLRNTFKGGIPAGLELAG